ncbi:esterase/lipase family protein [Limnobacter sp.]|uniref:esterase/lipase family protein n=1 Tax=Limnobacter sp. TaxID=2003368 RepID=UPI0035126044
MANNSIVGQSHSPYGMGDVARLAAREGYLFGLSFLFRQRIPSVVPPISPNFENRQLPLVVLVPGYLEKPGCFAGLYDELLWSGVRVALYQPRYTLASVAQMAQHFQEYLDGLLNLPHCQNSHTYLVGHSMGGLIVRQAMAKQWNTGLPVQHLFTLATPNNGTQMAHLGVGDCVQDMLPGSAFLAELNQSDVDHRHRMSSVIATPDCLILSAKNAHLEGAANHVMPGSGHMALLDDPRLVGLLQQRVQIDHPHQLIGA